MIFSLSSVINHFAVNALITVFFLLLFRSSKIRRAITIPAFLFISLVIIIRFLFPFEFFFAKTIPVKAVYPEIYHFLDMPLFTAGTVDIRLCHVLSVLWAGGSAVCFLRLLFRHHKLTVQIRRLDPITDPAVTGLISKINSRFSRPVRFTLKSTGLVKSPFISGILKPVIVLPHTGYDIIDLEYVLSHELYHYYDKHLHIKLFCELLTAVYFWNPFIYLLKREIYKCLEINVDYKVTKALDNLQKIAYMECLVKTARVEYTGSFHSSYTVAFSMTRKTDVTQRVHAILEDSGPNKKHRAFAVPCVAVLMLLPFFFIFEPDKIPDDIEEYTFELDPATAYFLSNGDGTYDLYDGEVYHDKQQSLYTGYKNY